MKKLSVALLLLITSASFGQLVVDKNSDWRQRIYLGGGFGLNGGRDYYGYRYFYASVTPVIGYMVTSNFSVGTGINYVYISYPDLHVKSSEYGGFPFLRYNIRQFFLTTEYNFISVDPNPFDDQNKRNLYNRWLIGGGLSQPLGKRGSINFEALYDILYENTGPFVSPWVFRVFFSF